MEYRKFDSTYVVRPDPDEEICGQLLALAGKENIALAQISGLGAVKAFTVGVLTRKLRSITPTRLKAPMRSFP